MTEEYLMQEQSEQQMGKITFWNSTVNWMKLDIMMRMKSAFIIICIFCSVASLFSNISDQVSTAQKINARIGSLTNTNIESVLTAHNDSIFVIAQDEWDKSIIQSAFTGYLNSSFHFIDSLENNIVTILKSIIIPRIHSARNRSSDNSTTDFNLTVNKGLYSLPAYYIDRTLFWGEWIFPACYFFLIVSHLYPLSRWMHNKQLVLLNVAGVTDHVIWIGFVFIDLIYCFITSLLFSIFEYTHAKIREQSNFLLIFLFFLFASFAMYFSAIFMAPIFNRPGRVRFFIFIYVALISQGWILPSVLHINIKFNCYLYTSAIIHNFYSNAYVTLQNNESFTFTNPGYAVLFSTPQLFGLVFFQIFIFVFFLTVFTLFIPKEWGLAPIDIRKAFQKITWQRFFRRSKDFEEDTSKPFLSITNLTKTYKRKVVVKAVDNVDFDISKGEVILLIGPNGSGKTTLLQSLTGAIPTDSGNLSVYGQQADFLDLQRCTGYCYQENVFFDNLNVRQHLAFFAKLRGVKKEDVNDQIDKISTMLDIENLMDRDPNTMSAGQKRLVSTAMAFIGSPPLVILDEPTVGVDVSKRHRIWNIASYFKNTTTIIASHSLEEGEAVASRLFVIENGQIIFKGSPSELRQTYKCGYRLQVIVQEEENIDEIMEKVLEFCQTIVKEAELDFERGDSIMLPVCGIIPKLLTELDANIETLGAKAYTISIENLEHVMLRMIADGDHY